jgi:ribosomal protein S5
LYSVSRPSFVESTIELPSGVCYYEGVYICRHGIASTYRQFESATIRFVWCGRLYARRINRPPTHRGLGILAGRFVREIVEAKP